MAVEWSGLGPELLVRLDRQRAEPLGAQLREQLREAIRSGRLRAGERLPSSRTLARELGVSRGLVQECYGQLSAEGYLGTVTGSATRVAARAVPAPSVPARPAPPAGLRVDFRSGVPDLTSFPMRDWLWALGEAGRAAPSAASGYGDPRGSAVLREVLAAYLRRVRGAAVDPAHLVICTGFAQGINLLLRVLAAQGVRQVALEDPGDRDNDPIAVRAGLVPVPVPVDRDGIDAAALAASPARAAVLTPAHQTPTGVALAAGRRQALVAWAARVDGYLIEDEYDAEFRYDRAPVGSLQGLAPDRVFSLGSVSKSLAPALRLGWIACPPRLTEAVAQEKRLADRGSPGLDQLALARLLESGRYDRHLRRMRAVYASRRQVLVDSLARYAPGVALSGLAAGFHAVAGLPTGVREAEVVAAARERSVGLYGMSGYRLGAPAVPGSAVPGPAVAGPAELVLGFGNVPESAIRQGIATVADLLR